MCIRDRLRYMNKSVFSRRNFNKCSEGHKSYNLAFIYFSNLRAVSNCLYYGKSLIEMCIRDRFSNSIITIEYFNNLLKSYDTMILTVPIHPLCNERINFSLTSDYCGILNIKIKSIQIYDFIKLFSCRIKSDVVKMCIRDRLY